LVKRKEDKMKRSGWIVVAGLGLMVTAFILAFIGTGKGGVECMIFATLIAFIGGLYSLVES
jgi:hypothetical protein